MSFAPPSDAKTRFSDRVDDYVRHRPSYPTDAIDAICAFAKVRAGSVVADVGAGTGISCGPFLDRGCTVYAVEPNVDMRRAAESTYAGKPSFHAVDGSAEQTTLSDQSVDLLTSFQSFHWFDQEHVGAEFRRVAKPGGCIAIVWNERKRSGSPFLNGYDELLLKYGTDYRRVVHRSTTVERLGSLFLCPFIRVNFANEQTFEHSGLVGRLRSSSYTPTPDMDSYAPMMAALRELFDRSQVNGVVRLEYETEVFLGRLP